MFAVLLPIRSPFSPLCVCSPLPVLSCPVMTSFDVLLCFVALFSVVQFMVAPDAPFVPLATSTPVPGQNGSQAAGVDNVSEIALCQ